MLIKFVNSYARLVPDCPDGDVTNHEQLTLQSEKASLQWTFHMPCPCIPTGNCIYTF